MIPRWLVAPQEFKGTLTAAEAAQAMKAGIREAAPEVLLDLAPLADGGPGTVDALLTGTPGERRVLTVQGPLGEPVEAAYALLESGQTAVIEMATASGLSLMDPANLDIRQASTYGTGELMRAALDAGCTRIIVGLGGSATNDAGTGALTALGYRFLDAKGRPLPPGGAALRHLARVDVSHQHPQLAEVELLAATDVTAPLLGPNGASRLFGPQKGADPDTVEELEEALQHFSKNVGQEFVRIPGVGAAGGLGYGLAVLASANIVSGYELVAQALHLERRMAVADMVLTGEGRYDRQTAFGKGPAALAYSGRALGRPVVLFAGSVLREKGLDMSLFSTIVEAGTRSLNKAAATQALQAAAAQWAATARHIKPYDARETIHADEDSASSWTS
ncbi:glycerate kinase [Stigmatella sp. ncwal1]|uniref:Glycerate kinase n=1 Tax=Stigmatella ashevillensis TaxID=2995309 RepID=A0ABT5D7C4_9BACT|nr:glycerate kinase [Stigmatella ashevillena]MDC0709555.1 glycerate kinase [Stigmatella ashevillena]